jgi:hypothetical protein
VSHHMTKARDLFNSLMWKDSGIHVEHDDDSKYRMKGEGTNLFQLEVGGLFEAQDVTYVRGMKMNFPLVSVM